MENLQRTDKFFSRLENTLLDVPRRSECGEMLHGGGLLFMDHLDSSSAKIKYRVKFSYGFPVTTQALIKISTFRRRECSCFLNTSLSSNQNGRQYTTLRFIYSCRMFSSDIWDREKVSVDFSRYCSRPTSHSTVQHHCRTLSD